MQVLFRFLFLFFTVILAAMMAIRECRVLKGCETKTPKFTHTQT